jgi:hypothetical protein
MEEEPMPDPGFARPDLCSIRTAGEQEEIAVAVCGESSADGYPPGWHTPSGLREPFALAHVAARRHG